MANAKVGMGLAYLGNSNEIQGEYPGTIHFFFAGVLLIFISTKHTTPYGKVFHWLEDSWIFEGKRASIFWRI
jgi:hypothetical protein